MIFVITKRKTVEYLNVIPLSLKPNIPYRTGLSKFKTDDNKKKLILKEIFPDGR